MRNAVLRRVSPASFLLVALLAAAPVRAGLDEVDSVLVASGLSEPIFATAPDGDDRLFIVERSGTIRVLSGGAVLATPFLDLSDRVGTNGEGGLLGLAFDPDYPNNGVFYVYYTDDAGDSVLSRFTVSADPDVATPTESVLLTVDQPFQNHNGGTVAFGPDGFLYLGLGDGGSSYDPEERAQDPTVLLGKMLRLDVGVPPAPGSVPVPPATGDYAIPADNPFVGVAGVRDEIWALGLRNPYRFSFDRGTGDLWIADVGQNDIEEVDFEPAGDPGGRNWGWDVMEGLDCVTTDPAPAPPCLDASLSLPLHQYDHSGGNCSITGGFVHRGEVAAIAGHYVFGDFCTGRVWSLDPDGPVVTERTAELGAAGGAAFDLAGFGEDGQGRTYVVLRNGEVHRITNPPPECGNGVDDDGDGLVDGDDPGCRDAAWPEEDPECQNGLDDDADGDVDLADVQCTTPWVLVEAPIPQAGCGADGSAGAATMGLLLGAMAGRRRRRR
jgi:glucose/arabinose dehydrogenase